MQRAKLLLLAKSEHIRILRAIMGSPIHEGLYAIEDPLRDGNNLRCFRSGFGLRVARIEAPEGQLVGYGEAPTIEVALADAAENYHTGESYERQYRSADARYQHKIYGSEKSVSPLDAHLNRGGKLLAHWACNATVAGLYTLESLPSNELMEPLYEEGEDSFPVMLTQFGRVFAINRTDRGLSAVAMPMDNTEQSGWFACVVQNGTGDTLREAVEKAFEAEKVESERDVFQ